MRRALLFIFLGLLGGSCFNEGDCLKTASNNVRIDFYQRVNNQAATLNFSGIVIDGVDTLYKGVSEAFVKLPVNPNSDTTQFILNYNERTDYITFKYSQYSKVITSDCGAFTYFNHLQIIDTSFDPSLVKIVYDQLIYDAVKTKDNVSNVSIYF